MCGAAQSVRRWARGAPLPIQRVDIVIRGVCQRDHLRTRRAAPDHKTKRRVRVGGLVLYAREGGQDENARGRAQLKVKD